MAYFDPKTTRVYRAVTVGRMFPESSLRKVLGIGIIASVALFVAWVIGWQYTDTWRLFIIIAVASYALWIYIVFFETYLDVVPPPPANDQNVAEYLDYQAMKIARSFTGGDISRLLVSMLSLSGFSFVLMRIGTSPQEFQKALLAYLHAPQAQAANDDLATFLAQCLEEKRARVGQPLVLNWRDLFLGLATRSLFLKQHLFDAHIEPDDVLMLIGWEEQDFLEREAQHRFWSRENLLRTRGVGHDWAAGYTNNLEKFAVEVTALPAYAGFTPHLYGRKAETEQVERILARDGKNNVVLVGPAGVGKTLITAALAERISLGDTLAPLAHKRVLRLDLGAVLAGSESTHEIEARLRLVLADAVQAGNVILLVDNIHAMFDPSLAPGTVDASELVLPFLTSNRLQIIGLTTPENYHETIGRDAGLSQIFQKVDVAEPAKEHVYAIMRDVVPHIEAHDGVWILFQAIRSAIELSDRYIKSAPYPEKAIDLLQESAVYALSKKQRSVVLAGDIEAVLQRKTGIPVGSSATQERQILLSLESELHKRVVGQDVAITAIANAMRRARSGISSEKKPIGSFLFLGPTGVGKTETAKALAAAYFGSEERMARYDMSEYQDASSINRLIGHDSEGGLLTTEIIDHPFSLVLLDEIEKAHPNILDVFLQVLDDGRLTDALGRTVDFTNAIIIATSNAGAEMIREDAALDHETIKEQVLDALQKQGTFRPEFLNRFDGIIMFRPLTQTQEEQVATYMLADLNRRLEEKGITVTADPDALKQLVALGFDPEFGARPLRRVIQEHVENVIAKKLLSEELPRGSTLVLHAADLQGIPGATDSAPTVPATVETNQTA